MNELVLDSPSPETTQCLGRRLASMLSMGAVVALYGDLASGKTCLVRGMAEHLACDADVHSPTFTIVNEYGVGSPKLYHIDLYRLSSLQEIAALGWDEWFGPRDIHVVEWANRAEGLLPPIRLDAHLEHAGNDHRRIFFQDHGVLPPGWQDVLLAELGSQ